MKLQVFRHIAVALLSLRNWMLGIHKLSFYFANVCMCNEQVIVMWGNVTHSVGHSMDGRNLANICYEKSLSSPKFFNLACVVGLASDPQEMQAQWGGRRICPYSLFLFTYFTITLPAWSEEQSMTARSLLQHFAKTLSCNSLLELKS